MQVKTMLPVWIRTADYAGGNVIELLPGGKPFFEVLEALILAAREEIHFQVYILNTDETGTRVLGLLKDAVRRGVAVYLLLDAFGSSTLSKKAIREIQDSGIHFRLFSPFFSKNLSVGRRMHHKIVVVDARVFLVGGMNIADRYNDMPEQRAWLDFAVQVSGPLARQAQERCLQLWQKKPWMRLKPSPAHPEPMLARLRVNDWLRGKSEITAGLRKAIRQAKSSIVIAAAYFIPPRSLMTELRKATQRGVEVRILLGQASDVLLAEMATRYLYDWMLKNHIHIYEWTPTVMHAKVMVVDGVWVSLGSFNLNFLSMFESVELNVEVADAAFAQHTSAMLERIMATECEPVTKQVYLSRYRWLRRAVDWFGFVVLWLLAHVFFFLDKKSKRPKGEPGPF